MGVESTPVLARLRAWPAEAESGPGADTAGSAGGADTAGTTGPADVGDIEGPAA
jgi:hypothetical protein